MKNWEENEMQKPIKIKVITSNVKENFTFFMIKRYNEFY